MNDYPLSTVIVLTKSARLEHTKVCLEYLEKNTTDFELILIRDDPRFFGFSKNNNRGMRIGLGKYFVLMNDDCFATQPGWLDKLIAKAEQEIRIGIVAPVLHFPTGEPQYDLELRKDKDGYCRDLPFACVLIKRQMVEELGYMDESFRYGGEDSEYCVRAIRKGWKLVVADDVHLVHLLNQSKGGIKSLVQNSRGNYRWDRSTGHDMLPSMLRLAKDATYLQRRFLRFRVPTAFKKLRAIRNRLLYRKPS